MLTHSPSNGGTQPKVPFGRPVLQGFTRMLLHYVRHYVLHCSDGKSRRVWQPARKTDHLRTIQKLQQFAYFRGSQSASDNREEMLHIEGHGNA